jgi:spermidine synthase
VARLLVLLAAFACAACGLVYELELVAVGSYLLDDSVTQASVVLSVMVFAMGLGSLLVKRFTCRPAVAFAVVEGALALTGGLSVLALYADFVWLGHYAPVLVAFALLIGVLMGAEIPLLMTLIQRIRRQDPGCAVADLFAADYVGALVGGLAFPFLLLPQLGQATGALLTGGVNALAGAVVVLWLFRDESPARVRAALWAGCGAVLAVLAAAAALTGAFERAARQALYGAPVRFATQTRYQDIVLTGGTAAGRAGPPLRLYLGGRLALCAADQARYREDLVDPALAGPHARVLVLGSGDGLVARQVLAHPGVTQVTLVEQDPAVLRLARQDAALAALNGHALADPRLRVVTADPFGWLRARRAHRAPRFDAVITDLPAVGTDPGGTFATEEFYGLVRRALAPGGSLAVHAGSPWAARGVPYWTVAATLRAAGLRVAAYAAPAAPACGGPPDWGFLLAAGRQPRPRLPAAACLLTAPGSALRPSTLLHPAE